MKNNIAFMFLLRGTSILISFFMVPLTLGYVNTDTYGIWITISSIVGWMSFFDIGLNQSLRNRFTEAKSKNDHVLAQKYVSTTYALLALIFGSLLIVLTILNFFIDWSSLLNLPKSMSKELTIAMSIVIVNFCLRFVLSSINIILLADQKPALSSIYDFVQQLVIVIIIIFLVQTTKGTLLLLVSVYCIVPIIILVAFNLILFSKKYKDYAPKFSMVDFSLTKSLLSFGFKFFIIQIAGIVQFQTVNFIIMRYFGPSDVTSYNIAFRYFNMLYMVFTILITPVWSAVTEANAQDDIIWIKNTVKKYQKTFFVFLLCGILMFAISGNFYTLWLGNNTVNISYLLSFFVMINIMVFIYGGIFVNVLNGIGALKIQFYASIISPIIFILICYVMIGLLHFGIYSIVIASILANVNGFFLAPLQYNKIFFQNKKGIWVK
ncbi:MAG: oligosaccharide flippase family protein [Paludibacter sp.]|nr:oligosaccharide flippase family protein [Paludibacter sp.]